MVIYGLIGKKLTHSFSADFFNKKFSREGYDAHYYLFPLENIKEFSDLLSDHPDFKGLNVTIPYKEEIIPYLDELSDEAREIGAVNVIKFISRDNEVFLKGYNSDCYGFENSLVPLLNDKVKKALVLGTGGASKAVSYVLKKLGIKSTNVSRNPEADQYAYADLTEDIIAENLLIVNTTPLGMYPDNKTFPPIPYEFITSDHICYDLVYNPEESEFLKKSARMGATVKNGLEMLHLQAMGAWEIWNK